MALSLTFLTTLSTRALVLQYISHSHTQSTHVQCFILMSSFLCSVNCLPQAWILIGQAVRVGQDLGLHVSVPILDNLAYLTIHSGHLADCQSRQ